MEGKAQAVHPTVPARPAVLGERLLISDMYWLWAGRLIMRQLEKARTLEQPTFPTISFECAGDGSVIAIWSLVPDTYQVFHMTDEGKKITIETDDRKRIEHLVELYFSGERQLLEKEMSEDKTVVIVASLWDKFINFFRGNPYVSGRGLYGASE